MKILFATDGSDSAGNAVEMLQRFPFPDDRRAVVMTVVDSKLLAVDRHLVLEGDQDRLLRESEQVLREESEQLLAAASARLEEAGWVCSTEVRAGDPAEEIIKTADELKPDMIVLGSHGLTGVRQFLLGSVSGRVLRHAHCSVMIVKPLPGWSVPAGAAGRLPPWRILVAYDDSEPAREAIDLCASLPLDDHTEVSVVGVEPLIHMYRQDIHQQLSDIWRQQRHARQKTLESAVIARRWTTPRVAAELLEGSSISKAILDFVEDRGIDLVVIGNKGHSTFKRFLLGSITNYVADHAACSVMVVRTRTSQG
jgi:nucleotide-binding universal stress UspA family protein